VKEKDIRYTICGQGLYPSQMAFYGEKAVDKTHISPTNDFGNGETES
jgi:hypothetical protein